MINQNEMLFRLNYTLIQITSSRLLIEIKQLKTFNQQINSNSRLIYCLNHASTGAPIVRGSIDMSSMSLETHPRRFYLAIEPLQANTSYALMVFLKTNLNTDSNYVQLVANRTFTTPVRASTINSTTFRQAKTSEDDSDEDDG